MRHVLDNALVSIAGPEFAIYGEVNNSTEYEANVVFSSLSSKPAWGEVQTQMVVERWNYVRVERNKKLTKSDWSQLSDVPLSDSKREEWQVYRQSLRDVPSQSDPLNVTWPSAPA